MGGAFGGKEVQANAWAGIAALGAWKTRRPVRVRLTRELDMALTGKRHPLSRALFEPGSAATAGSRALRLALYSDGGWSLDLSEPIMWRSLFHCDNAYYLPAVDVTRARVPDAQDVADCVPRVRRAAGDARHRRDPLAGRHSGCRSPATSSASATSIARATPRITGRWSRTQSASASIWDAAEGDQPLRRTPGGDRRVQRAARRSEARAGDHAGEVRHLVHRDVLQPGRRARAHLPRRQRAGEPRRHRDGPGPLHQDPAARRRRARRDARPRPRDADAHRQGARTPPRRPRRPAPISTAPPSSMRVPSSRRG